MWFTIFFPNFTSYVGYGRIASDVVLTLNRFSFAWESENLILVEDVGSEKPNHQPTESTQADPSEANLT